MVNNSNSFLFDYGNDDYEDFFYIPYLQIFDHSHDSENKKSFPTHLHIIFGIFYWYVDIRFGKETILTEEEETEYYKNKFKD